MQNWENEDFSADISEKCGILMRKFTLLGVIIGPVFGQNCILVSEMELAHSFEHEPNSKTRKRQVSIKCTAFVEVKVPYKRFSPPHGTLLSMPWRKQFHTMEKTVSCR